MPDDIISTGNTFALFMVKKTSQNHLLSLLSNIIIYGKDVQRHNLIFMASMSETAIPNCQHALSSMLLLLNKCKRKKVSLEDNQGASRWLYRGSTPTHFTGFSHRQLYTADLYAHNLHAPVFPRARIARTLPKLVIDITLCVCVCLNSRSRSDSM